MNPVVEQAVESTSPADSADLVPRLRRRLDELRGGAPAAVFSALVAEGLGELPSPGSGLTLERWRALAAVSAHDLSLAKLYEAHTDALAILKELGQPLPLGWTWGVWAAEPPQARLILKREAGDAGVIEGRKAWCAGAGVVDHALATAWLGSEGPFLVAVDLSQEGVQLDSSHWQAIGMADSVSLDVLFDQVPARIVGAAGDYLNRPGFSHGGAGIASCWYGAAAALGESLRQQVEHRREPHAAAHLGAVDVALAGAASVLREAAALIDRDPGRNAQALALHVRGVVEAAVAAVLAHVGRALGATPFCRDPHFARLATDLPVFVRQSHAERDLEALGRLRAQEPTGGWAL